ncbi:hypothetical protein [Succinatimonas hippei]|uniref:hypothetical protein n=1 Tax=Succinatimonas hippei TaxID=626938 RepID=UPI00255C44DE|nr:hypothetical protein [Succinatimonas hippei]
MAAVNLYQFNKKTLRKKLSPGNNVLNDEIFKMYRHTFENLQELKRKILSEDHKFFKNIFSKKSDS